VYDERMTAVRSVIRVCVVVGSVQSRLFAIIGIFTVYETVDLYDIISYNEWGGGYPAVLT
jgi:hypothetical protein